MLLLRLGKSLPWSFENCVLSSWTPLSMFLSEIGWRDIWKVLSRDVF